MVAKQHSDCHGSVSDLLKNAKPFRRSSHSEDKQVKANKGAAGIDGMKVGDFPDFAKAHWEKVISKLAKGSYSPSAVRSVQIPKAGGKFRQLGIPQGIPNIEKQWSLIRYPNGPKRPKG